MHAYFLGIKGLVLKIPTYSKDFGNRAMDSEQKQSSCKRE